MYLDLFKLALKGFYDTEKRDGIHVTDLTLCPRQSIFRKLESQPVTLKELNFFTTGRSVEELISNIVTQFNNKFTKKKHVSITDSKTNLTIIGEIDLYDSEHNIPIECKTYRSSKIETPKAFHLEQLKSYMALTDAETGIIFYQLILHFGEQPFVEFEVHMTKQQREQHIEKLFAEASDYHTNLVNQTPLKAKGVMLDPAMNWKCDDCPFKQRCMEFHHLKQLPRKAKQ